VLAGLAVVAAVAALYVWLARSGLIDLIADRAALRAAFDRLGVWGPVTVVALEAVAIVASPLPSAPVAFAAGAIYGAFWGALLIVIGAGLGAVVAFLIARWLGFEAIRRWGVAQRYLEMVSHDHSQRWLMGAVFVSRLIPFVSFDAVSYLAGLTPLAFWRFALATLTGIVPVSFLFAYAGETLIGVSTDLLLAVIAGLVALPLVAAAARALWTARGGHHTRQK
jgi:uncharacterized membrane protein YdjX (TVP38/TMEM64 family)